MSTSLYSIYMYCLLLNLSKPSNLPKKNNRDDLEQKKLHIGIYKNHQIFVPACKEYVSAEIKLVTEASNSKDKFVTKSCPCQAKDGKLCTPKNFRGIINFKKA